MPKFKTKPNVNYFVGRFQTGTKNRVMRRTIKGGLLHRFHVYVRGQWLKTRESYVKASAYVATREQARNLKQQLDAR